jgi:hypothetical protein
MLHKRDKQQHNSMVYIHNSTTNQEDGKCQGPPSLKDCESHSERTPVKPWNMPLVLMACSITLGALHNNPGDELVGMATDAPLLDNRYTAAHTRHMRERQQTLVHCGFASTHHCNQKLSYLIRPGFS